MDFFLTIVGIALLSGLLYAALGEWRKASYEQKLFMIDTLVAAAQQLYGKDPGSMRFDWVAGRIKARWPNSDEGELEALIEAAVYRLRQLQAKQLLASDNSHGLDFWAGSGRHN